MVLTAIHLDIPAGKAFVSAGPPSQRWSNGSLTRSVRAYASKVSRMIALPIPKICSDVQQLGAQRLQGAAQLPPSRSTAAFLGSWVSPGFLPSGLQPLSRASSLRGLVHTTEQQESDIVELEAREVETYGKLMDTMRTAALAGAVAGSSRSRPLGR